MSPQINKDVALLPTQPSLLIHKVCMARGGGSEKRPLTTSLFARRFGERIDYSDRLGLACMYRLTQQDLTRKLG